jgi:hypothetical protein
MGDTSSVCSILAQALAKPTRHLAQALKLLPLAGLKGC